MQELIIKNVKTAEFRDVNLNQIFDPDGTHQREYAFQIGDVASPYRSQEGKLCVTFYTLLPGKSNYPYHQHTGIEEVFYIISGSGILKSSSGEIDVSEGDVIVVPANENGAHMLTNNTDAPLVFLDVDTVDSREVVFYPDAGTFRVMTDNFQGTFKKDSGVNHLDGA